MAPPIHRGSMVPTPWRGFWARLKEAFHRDSQRPAVEPVQNVAPLAWELAAGRRRRALLGLIAASAVGAALLLTHAQPISTHPVLRIGQVALFTLLFAWVAAGFFTAMSTLR